MITAKQRSGQMLQNQWINQNYRGPCTVYGYVDYSIFIWEIVFLLTVALNALNLYMLYIREEIMIVAIRKTILNENFFS